MDLSTSIPSAPIASMTLEEACKQVDAFRKRELHHSDEIYDTAESMKAIDDAKLWEKEAGWVPPKTKPRKKKETKTRKNRGDRRTGARNRWAGQRFKMDPRQASKYFVVAEELKREDISGTGLSLDKMEQVAMAPVEFRYTLIELGKTYSASALRGGRLKTEHLLGKFDLTEVLRLLAIAVSTSALKEASDNQEKKERKRKDPSPELVTRHLMKAMEELERLMAVFPVGLDEDLLELMQEQMAILQERMEDLMSSVEAGASTKDKEKDKDKADSAKTEEGKATSTKDQEATSTKDTEDKDKDKDKEASSASEDEESKETSTKSEETSKNNKSEETSKNDESNETSKNNNPEVTSKNNNPEVTSKNNNPEVTSKNDNLEATSTNNDRRKESREEDDDEEGEDLPPLSLTGNTWYYPICEAINTLPPQTKEVLRDHLYQMVLGICTAEAKAMILGLYDAAKMRKARIRREDFDKFVSPLFGDDRDVVGNICVEILVLAELPEYAIHIRRLYTHDIPNSVVERIATYMDVTYLSQKTPEDQEYIKNGGPDAPLVVQGRMILRRMLQIREDLRKGIKPNIHIQRWLYESTIKLAELKTRFEMDLLY